MLHQFMFPRRDEGRVKRIPKEETIENVFKTCISLVISTLGWTLFIWTRTWSDSVSSREPLYYYRPQIQSIIRTETVNLIVFRKLNFRRTDLQPRIRTATFIFSILPCANWLSFRNILSLYLSYPSRKKITLQHRSHLLPLTPIKVSPFNIHIERRTKEALVENFIWFTKPHHKWQV